MEEYWEQGPEVFIARQNGGPNSVMEANDSRSDQVFEHEVKSD
jgi:hypothetical protein